MSMTWIDTLDLPIEEALRHFPEQAEIASIQQGPETFLISRETLLDMQQMQLAHLPVSTVALPGTWSEMLTRPHQENIVRDYSHHLGDYFPNFFVAAIYELQSLFSVQQ